MPIIIKKYELEMRLKSTCEGSQTDCLKGYLTSKESSYLVVTIESQLKNEFPVIISDTSH